VTTTAREVPIRLELLQTLALIAFKCSLTQHSLGTPTIPGPGTPMSGPLLLWELPTERARMLYEIGAVVALFAVTYLVTQWIMNGYS
jgi:hypothetical protein